VLVGLGVGLPARNVETSMVSRAEQHVHDLKRRPIRRERRNSFGHLLGRRVGGDIEVLGRQPEQQVAHAAADHEGLE
jgi:hypothetical protein